MTVRPSVGVVAVLLVDGLSRNRFCDLEVAGGAPKARVGRLPGIGSDGWQTRFLRIICKRCTTHERRYGELLPALAIAPSRVPW